MTDFCSKLIQNLTSVSVALHQFEQNISESDKKEFEKITTELDIIIEDIKNDCYDS